MRPGVDTRLQTSTIRAATLVRPYPFSELRSDAPPT